MHDEERVIAATLKIASNRDRAIDWYRNTPMPEFNDQTAEQLVVDNQTDAVLSYRTSSGGESTG